MTKTTIMRGRRAQIIDEQIQQDSEDIRANMVLLREHAEQMNDNANKYIEHLQFIFTT